MAEDEKFAVKEFTASDGYLHKYRRFDPTDHAKAEIVYLHGIQSHAGWYDHSSQRLADAGFAVSFFDRRGSGQNQESRGDAPGFRRLIDDVAEFIKSMEAKPIYVLALSWGGKVAVALDRRHPGLVSGLVLMCPGFFAQVRPPLGQRLAILWSRLVNPTRKFPIPLSEPELFTENPRWLEFLRKDPLALHQATARLLVESVRLDTYLRFSAKCVKLPVLLLLAGKDRIIRNDCTRRYVESFGSSDKTILEYPDSHHTLEFEAEPDPIIDDVIGWLNDHLPGTHS